MRPTQEELKQILTYNAETGEFYSLLSVRAKLLGINEGRYIRIYAYGNNYYAHDIAWVYTYGYWPRRIDHKDLNKKNNILSNLRECTQSQNAANSGLRSNNTSGYKGVYKSYGKWCARITVNYKPISLGAFNTLEEAAAAYYIAAAYHFGEYVS
jgi:hypothetical protein